jgi:hypothetical protein
LVKVICARMLGEGNRGQDGPNVTESGPILLVVFEGRTLVQVKMLGDGSHAEEGPIVAIFLGKAVRFVGCI